MMTKPMHYVSYSGGKDSTACLVMAVKRRGTDRVRAIFADTGNEHELTHEYVRYATDALGVELITLRADFTDQWWHRAQYVKNKWPEKGVPMDVCERVFEFMKQGPTGNPFLDLCIIKGGRFPSRRAQFCTQFLKRDPILEFFMERADAGEKCVSWQGIRWDESTWRRNAKPFNRVAPYLYNIRPILSWTAQQTVDYVRSSGLKLNPLYSQGMNRVGCMPCINVSKGELRSIARRFPDHIDRIDEWEMLCGLASKRSNATFLPAPGDNETAFERGNIRARVEWSKTIRGGKLYDLFWDDSDVTMCESSYGLCE
jgi:3'-phosphoadenosine 5'-phosphosulfate sulfotransferase (PAPS reductase)/FAD synthetase